MIMMIGIVKILYHFQDFSVVSVVSGRFTSACMNSVNFLFTMLMQLVVASVQVIDLQVHV